MKANRLLRASLALVLMAPLAVPCLGQDDGNTPPEVTGVTWEISRNVGGDALFGPFLPFVPFDPATETAHELDFLRANVTVFDPDFVDDEGNPADDEGVHYINQMLWIPVPGYPAPVPPPVVDDLVQFVPDGDGLRPGMGTSLTFPVTFQLPAWVGVNQLRLRGVIDFDVRWQFRLWLSNEEDPECTYSLDQFVLGCDGPVTFYGELIFAIENPVLAPPNPPAFADAGSDQIVRAGNTVTLDGSRTFDGFNVGFNIGSGDVFAKDIITYTWEWLSGPVRVEPTQTDQNDPMATVVLNTVGTYVYRLTVDDNFNALPTTDTVTIEVVADLPTNDAPRAVIRGPARAVTLGSIVTLDGSESTDPDGDDLTFRWRQTDELGGELPVDTLVERFQPISGSREDVIQFQAVSTGTFYFQLLVSDGEFVARATFPVEIVDAATAGTQVQRPMTDGDGTLAETDSVERVEPSVVPFLPTCGAGLAPLSMLPLGLLLLRRTWR